MAHPRLSEDSRLLHTVMLATLRDDLAAINRALDEAESTRDREKQTEYLERALRASARAVDGFLGRSDLAETVAAARDAVSQYEDAIGQTWDDVMLFQAFLEAERRLFEDLGLDGSTRDRLVGMMREMHSVADWQLPGSEKVDTGLEALREELSAALEGLEREEDRRGTLRLVRRGFLVVGGAFVLGANALIGLPAAPVTGGLSVVGAGVSAGLGGAMMGSVFTS